MIRTKQFSESAKVFAVFNTLALAIQRNTREQIAEAIDRARPKLVGKQSAEMIDKLSALVETNNPQYSIFAVDGNGKLPFVAFSSLPGVTCPGAGSCLEFCYSFNAWRFPHAFGRQAHNAYLMRFNRETITRGLDALHASRKFREGFDFRLYVDGDFSSTDDVRFWMRAISLRPLIRAYGYSKSFDELLTHHVDGGLWPSNYLLNLSSGHRHDAHTISAIKGLPIYRGEFRAVSIGRRVKSAEHGTREVNAAIRAASPDKIFTCPGKCGACVPHGHACGSERFRNIPIAIAIH